MTENSREIPVYVTVNMLHQEIMSRETWQRGCEGMINALMTRICDLEKENSFTPLSPESKTIIHEKINRIGILEAQVNTLYKIIDDLIQCLHAEQKQNERVDVGIYPTNVGCQL